MLALIITGAKAIVHVPQTGQHYLDETSLKAGVAAAAGDYLVALQIHCKDGTFYINNQGKAQSSFSTTGETTWIVKKTSDDKYLLKTFSGNYIKTLGGSNSTAATFTTNSSEALKFNPVQSTSTDGNMESGYVANKAIWWNVDGGSNRINTNGIGTSNTIFQNNGTGCWTCLFTYKVMAGYNCYTGDTKTITETQWKTQGNWITADTWNVGPGYTNSNMWSPIYLQDVTATGISFEGWNLRLDLVSSSLTATTKKIQAGGTVTINVDEKSELNLTLSPTDANNDPGTHTFNIDGSVTIKTKSNHFTGTSNNIINLGTTGRFTLTADAATTTGNDASFKFIATLKDPTTYNEVQSRSLATFTNVTVRNNSTEATGSDGWTKIDNKDDLEAQTAAGKYYSVETTSSGVTLHTFRQAIYHVAEGTTVSLSAITNYSSYEEFHVPSGSTLNIDVADFDLTKVYGLGNVVLDADVTLSGGKSTVATGKLIINEGKTLTLGAGDTETNSIESFTSINLIGTITHRNSKATLNNVTVPADKTGKIFAYDMGDDSDGFKLAGTTTLNGNLTVCSKWNFQMKVDELAGAGTWLICGTTGSEFDDTKTSSNQDAVINIGSSPDFTGTIHGNNSNASVIVNGTLSNCTFMANHGTPKLADGALLDGVILDGTKRISTSGTVTIKDLAGNNLSSTTNDYALVGTGTINFEGTCDLTKKSDNTSCDCAKIGYPSESNIIIKSGANVTATKIFNSDGNNAAITVEGTINATKLYGIVTLAEGSITTLSEATPFNDGAVTISGDATLNLRYGAITTITQNLTVNAGKTLTIDGGESNEIVRLTGTITNNGTIKFTNAAIEGGEVRDCSTLSLPYTYENCTLVINETTDDFAKADETITITNIPSGFTSVRLRRVDRRYVTLDVDNGTATFTDTETKVSGTKCLYDFTFSKETLAERKIENTSVILNSGSRGSSNGLNYDGSFNSGNSYNEETGLLKAKSTPWRHMTGDNAWPDNYSVAVYANVPDIENGCLMAFGSSTNGSAKYLALLRGTSSNEIKLVKGDGTNNAFEVIATMSAENATVAKHLVIFTKNGSTFKVYCDGVNVATTTYDQNLGTGFQIGSVHGGIGKSGIIRIDEMSDDVKNAVEIQSIRIFNGVLTDDQMSALMKEFPYVSKGGSYSRTISADANLGEDGAWTTGETTAHIPTPVVEDASTYYPDVTITTSANATLTVNENATFGKTTFGGSGTLTIAANDGNSLNIGGAVIINSDVVVKFGAMDMSTSPVTKGTDANLTFDFSDFNFNKVYTTTKYQLTGLIEQDDTHITAILPSSSTTRSYTFAFDDNHYWLTVTVRAAQTVYAPSGITEIIDDMPVKLTEEAATSDDQLIPGDHLIINNTETIKLKQTSGFCTFEIQGGVTVTVNNRTTGGYALDGENITITNGTLKLNNNNDTDDAKINSATITIGENGTLDNYGWLTVDGTLTVNSDYDKTILNNSGTANPSQTRGTGKIVKGGTGTITMRAMPHCTENEVTTKHPIEITGGVLILSDGAKADAITGSGTLNVPAATSINVESIATGTTLTGNGNVTTTTFPTTTPTTTDWRGTVELAAGGDVGNLTTIFNAWGNANTVIKLNSVTGWFESDYTVNPTLNILSGATVNINNGYSNKEPKLTKVTGAGILQQTWSADAGTYALHIGTLTGFTGTLKGTNKPIVVEKLVVSSAPYANTRLIKTSGTVTLNNLSIGLEPTTAYTWETKTVDEVMGIYVATFNEVQLRREMAAATVSPYFTYIGTGVGKYTISLGKDEKYTSIPEFTAAIEAWSELSDCSTPIVTINQPTSAFYRIKAGDKYLQDARKSNSDTQRTLTDAEGADEAIGTLFYLNDDKFIGYQTGYGFGFSVCQTQDTEHLNSMLFTESSELGKYTIQSQKGTYASTDYNQGYWGVDGSDLSREDDAASGACWTLEPATSVPVTFNPTALGYATFNSPVALIVPKDEVKAYVCKIEGNTIKMYYADQLKDGDNWVLPENTPVLLYNSDYTNTQTVKLTITSDTDEEYENNGFNKGTVAAETPDADNYIYYALRKLKSGTVGFYQRANQTAALTGFRAWIAVPKTSEARNFTIEFDGDSDPTGIVEALGLEDANVEIYDLNGRKLSEYRKGINIVNGKKVFK